MKSSRFQNCFPRIYDKQIDATDFYPSYIKTYIDRDVRILRNITDYSAFTRFLKLCAGRCSQILNVTALAEDAGITRKTAEAWLSVLEASYIIYMRGALFENFVVSELLKRRLFAGKSDELYFWRDSNGVEIDVIEEDNLEIKAYEIKASETMNTAFFSNIKKIKEIAGLKAENTAVIYSGKSLPATSENGAYICWKEI